MGSLSKPQAAVLLVIVGVLATGVGIYAKDKVFSGPGCVMTSAGLAALVEGASGGRAPGERLLITTGASAACTPLANKLAEGSSDTVEFEIEDAAGESEYSLPASELVQPAPQPEPEPDMGNLVDCFLAYRDSSFMYQLCRNGVILP